MKARIFLLWILFSLTTSFFWEDEEKQLRQLHQSAETALHKGDYETAQGAFEELLSRIAVHTTKRSSQKYVVDWPTYVDMTINLATCYEELDHKSQAEDLLARLLTKHPPSEFLPRIRLMKARICAKRESPSEAYSEMQMITKQYPAVQWSNKDLSFYHALEDALNDYYDALIPKAKRYLMASMYPEAISLYQEILQAIEKGSYPKIKGRDTLLAKKIKYRLAECHFLAADYEKSLSLCMQEEGFSALENKIDREMLYLSAKCFREKKEFEKALEMLQHYTRLGDMEDLEHFDQALFEIGSLYYQDGQFAKAKRYFERLQQFKGRPSQLAALHLAHMLLNEKKPKEVETLLGSFEKDISTKHPLRSEYYYLRGLAAYTVNAFATAKSFLEFSIEEKGGCCWHNALYLLGWCYVRLGDDLLKAESDRMRFFKKAEENFRKILDDEAACLSLARLHLLRFQHFQDPESLYALESFLQEKSKHFSAEGELQALLLRAEAYQNSALKEQLYVLATQKKYQHCPSFAQAWYCRGVNYFQEGLADPTHPSHCFELATQALETAFRHTEKADSRKAAQILKLEAKANVYRNAPIVSLTLLEKLLSQFEESMEDREETFYLRGLLAAHLTDPAYFPIAEESFLQIIHSYPQGKYKEEACYALATLYFRTKNFEKAKHTFVQLASECPHSPLAPHSWFWAGESAIYLKENPSFYRCQIYENYPQSELAPEAFFHQFPYRAYREGIPEALTHLKLFIERFPSSSLQIAANYLLSIHEKDLQMAKTSLENALCYFTQLQNSNKILDTALIVLRYQVLLQLADVYFHFNTEKDLSECEQLLLALIGEFSQKEHPLTSLLKQNCSYPPLFEEGEFKLAQCYLKQGKNFLAQKIFSQMLTHYSTAGIQESPLLSLAWQEMGRLSLKCEDYETALNCFVLSQECGTRFFSDEQKLTLWLLQSDAFRGKKEYDTAMRLLSRAINEETASPLRLKAMYLRAEIYELEGRPELAVRQLEATAKKGGEWAHKAQEKLRVNYGYE